MRARSTLLALVFALVALAWFLYLRDFERPASALATPKVAALRERESRAAAELAAPPPLAPTPEAERVELEPELARPARAGVEREGTLQVRVLAFETGQPLPGAGVRLETPAGESLALTARRAARGTPDESLTTDAAGRADFRVAADTPYVVRAQFDAPLGRSAALAVRPIGAGELRTVVLQVFAAADRVWCARVTDGESGAPLAAARVTLVSAVRDRAIAVPAGADGELSLALSSKLAVRVCVEAEGYAARTLDVEPGHATRAEAQVIACLRQAALDVLVTNAELRPLGDFELELVLDSEPPVSERALLRLGQRAPLTMRTDAQGRARFDELPARVALTLIGKIRARTVRVVQLDEGLAPGELRALSWALGAGCVVSGAVLDQTGEPVANLPLWLAPAGNNAGFFDARLSREILLTTESDEHGAFRFEDVPAGEWRIGPRPRAQSYVVDSGGALSFFEGVEDADVEPAQRAAPATIAVTLLEGESERELVLEVWRGLYIRGQVVAADGRPWPGALVTAQSGELRTSARAREDGRFELGPLVPGNYALGTAALDEHCRPQNAAAGAEGVRLVLDGPSPSSKR